MARYPKATPVQSPVKGQLLWEVDVQDASAAPVTGRKVQAGEVIGYVQAFYGMEELVAAVSGTLVAVPCQQGDKVEKGEILAFIQ